MNFTPEENYAKRLCPELRKALIILNVYDQAAGEWEHRQLFFYSAFFVKFG